MTKKTITFEFEKETKNSVRYQELPEPGQAPVAGTIYLQKWFAQSAKTIEVTIETKDE